MTVALSCVLGRALVRNRARYLDSLLLSLLTYLGCGMGTLIALVLATGVGEPK